MDRWDFKDYVPTKKEKKIDREEFLSQFIQCPECGYRNKKVFLERTGCCNCCGKVLHPKAHMKYIINKTDFRGFLSWNGCVEKVR